MNESDKRKFRGLLVARWAELTGDVDGLRAETQNASGEVRMPTHMADLASDATALEDNFVQIETLGDEARRVKAALARLDADSYGLCAECGEPISPERLQALPYAELCITCQKAQESGQ